MPNGFYTCQQIADICGCSVTKANQSWNPAFDKAAMAYLYNPDLFLRSLIVRASELVQQSGNKTERFTDAEWQALYLQQTGRANRTNGKTKV